MWKNFQLSSKRSFIQHAALAGVGMMLLNPTKLFIIFELNEKRRK